MHFHNLLKEKEEGSAQKIFVLEPEKPGLAVPAVGLPLRKYLLPETGAVPST